MTFLIYKWMRFINTEFFYCCMISKYCSFLNYLKFLSCSIRKIVLWMFCCLTVLQFTMKKLYGNWFLVKKYDVIKLCIAEHNEEQTIDMLANNQITKLSCWYLKNLNYLSCLNMYELLITMSSHSGA